MKNLKIVIIAVICIGLICGGFYLVSQNNNSGNEDELTELEKVLVKDMKNDYPKTPREVAKFYNRIMSCYHQKKITQSDLSKLVDQMVLMFDETLLAKTPRDEYYQSVVLDVELYRKSNKYIASMTVCDSSEVIYKIDDRNGDELAFVDVDYFVNSDGQFTNSYLRFGMRKDEDGNWKILGVTLRENEDEE